MVADKPVNLCCCGALKAPETLQVMERQGYYEGKISCYRNVLFRMFFPCGKGSKQAGKCGKSIRKSADGDYGLSLIHISEPTRH